jgi:LemA protein
MWILLVVVALLAGFIIVIYNRLIGLRVRADNAWADIDVQLKRRHDLIPNLVETVKGYATHERSTLEAVIEARSRAVDVRGAGPAERAEAEGMLTRALGGLFALSEAYPQLRATENFQQLQGSLSAVEDALQNARRYYNAVVRDLNTAVQQFPSNMVASIFGFGTREFFEISEAERAVPQVKF